MGRYWTGNNGRGKKARRSALDERIFRELLAPGYFRMRFSYAFGDFLGLQPRMKKGEGSLKTAVPHARFRNCTENPIPQQ